MVGYESMKSPILFLIDDHEIFLLGLRSVLLEKSVTSLDHIQIFSREDVLLKSIQESPPDMLIADHILEETTGIELIFKAKKKHSTLKTLLISSVKDDELKETCIEHGIDGYIYKSEMNEKIIQAVSTILNGGNYFSEIDNKSVKRRSMDKLNPFSVLTKRELQIVEHLIRGETFREISDNMSISHKTVQQHSYNITQKMGKLTRMQLAQKAIKWKIIPSLEEVVPKAIIQNEEDSWI